MALTLIKNPIGHKLSESEINATIIDSAGDALVYTGFAHALSDGDYVYIESNFDAYNGYKYVDSIAYDSFKIKDSENSDPIEYVQDADITYRVSVLNHGWQAVHNPIVYELESDIYPNNIDEESYTPITVVSQTNNLGYTQLNLSAGIPGGATTLNYIELVGTNDLAGVYQIIDAVQPWSIVINLAYDASNSFSSLQVVNYYNNYAVNVRVVAGLELVHRWEPLKPYEVAATLQFIPDNEGKVKFSISDILKSYITTRNNLTLNTLPNNLDFMVSFYIDYFESYDESDGVEITTYEGEVTTDDFVGYAVNAMMPFKNESISHMSEYINEDVYLAKWLTLQDRPIAIVGRFFDLSFINQFLGSDIVITVNGVETLTITNPGNGVIRVPITPVSGDTELCVQASAGGAPESGGDTSAITLPALASWIGRTVSGPLYDWTTGAAPFVNLPGVALTPAQSEIIYCDYAFVVGNSYTITINITVVNNSGSSNPRTSTVYILDSSYATLASNPTVVNAGANAIPITFTAMSGAVKIGYDHASGRNVDITINSATGTTTTPIVPAIPAQIITEQICIDVIEECDTTYIPDPDDIRLTEDGDFRILE